MHWLGSGYLDLFGLQTDCNWSFGEYGVQLFFVLSGYLITSILIREKRGSAPKGKILRNFIIRRVLRLFPIYFLFLFTLIILGNTFVRENIFWYIGYLVNIKFYLEGSLVDVWSDHLWTLSIEEQFYVIFPIIFLFTKEKFEVIIPLFFILFSIIFTEFYSENEFASILTPGQIDFLGIGILLAMLQAKKSKIIDALTINYIKSLTLFSFVLCIILFYHIDKTYIHYFNYLVLIVFGLLVLNIADGYTGTIGNFLNNRLLRYIGKISYGMYIYHKIIPLIISIISIKFSIQINFGHPILYYMVNLIILLIVSHLSWKFIEKWFINQKVKFRS